MQPPYPPGPPGAPVYGQPPPVYGQQYGTPPPGEAAYYQRLPAGPYPPQPGLGARREWRGSLFGCLECVRAQLRPAW